MSALPPQADIGSQSRDVRFVAQSGQLSGGVLFGFLGQSRAQRAAARSSQGQEQAARSATGAPDFDLLVPAHESLHFLQGNGAIVVGIHCLEYALVRRLKLLQ